MSDTPWYRNGLRFRCTQCGNCCTGAPGYVWLVAREIRALAERLGFASADEFEAMYVRKIGNRKSLKEYPNGDCVFFDAGTRKCTVYEDRPRQCRTWPFWASNLKTPQDWEWVQGVCPGSGKGDLYSLEQIAACREEMRV